jgi:hypothetical protein
MPGVLPLRELYASVGFVPHPKQDEVLSDPSRFQVVAAGRRFGKSEIGGHRLLPEAFIARARRHYLESIAKRMEFWIVGPEYSDSEKEFRVVYNRLKQMQVPFDKPGTYNNPHMGDMHISLWDGLFQVHAKSAKHPETLVGEGLHGVILAEAAKLKERVWTKSLRPTLNDFGGWAQMTSTPEGKNWFYNAWQQGQNPDHYDWASWRMPAWSNPYVYRTPTTDSGISALRKIIADNESGNNRVRITERLLLELEVDAEIASLMMDLTQPMFNQEIGAMFTEYVGRVFQDFDEEVHVLDTDLSLPGWEMYGAVDYGFTNPSVWLLVAVNYWGDVIVLDEVYGSGWSPDEFADEIILRGACPSGVTAFYPDPASPGDSRILEKKLQIRARGNTGGEVNDRVEAIRRHLRRGPPHLDDDHPEKKPKIRFSRRCVNLIREFNDYRYPATRDTQDRNVPENPMKKDDHTAEALGRFFAGYFGKTTQERKRARQSVAQMG